MKHFESSVVDALRISALALASLVALFAVVQYIRHGGRPDATEMRDLGLLIALELAVIPFALTFLVRSEGPEPMTAAPVPRGTSIPNPWSY